MVVHGRYLSRRRSWKIVQIMEFSGTKLPAEELILLCTAARCVNILTRIGTRDELDIANTSHHVRRQNVTIVSSGKGSYSRVAISIISPTMISSIVSPPCRYDSQTHTCMFAPLTTPIHHHHQHQHLAKPPPFHHPSSYPARLNYPISKNSAPY